MRFLAAFVAIFGVACAVSAQDKIPLLIIDGQNNHNWKATTPILKDVLNRSGRFSVDVATTPSKEDKAIQKFRPDLKKYAVVVLNYNGETWGKELQKDFETLVGEGKLGVVVVHAANNAFGNWNEYNQMIGMGWRGNKGGDRLYVDDSGKEVRVPNGQGDGSGHRYTGEFSVTLRDAQHPVVKGMPTEWLHAKDELYDNMRGPIKDIHLIGTAYSKGTKVHEPMIWTVVFGKGRVFHTPMGHDVVAMKCLGFASVLERGSEWAATGKVSIPVPAEFPTATAVKSSR